MEALLYYLQDYPKFLVGNIRQKESPKHVFVAADFSAQTAQCHAARLAYCFISARHTILLKMRNASIILEVCNQEFSAPDRSFRTVSSAVQGHAYYFFLDLVLSHAGGNMSVMVLNSHDIFNIRFKRVLGREIVGMHVVSDDSRRDFQKTGHVINLFAEETITRIVCQVAYMLRHEGLRTTRDAKRIFQLCAACQHRFAVKGKLNVVRHESS